MPTSPAINLADHRIGGSSDGAHLLANNAFSKSRFMNVVQQKYRWRVKIWCFVSFLLNIFSFLPNVLLYRARQLYLLYSVRYKKVQMPPGSPDFVHCRRKAS